MSRAQFAFAILAILVVFSLIAGAIGTAVVDGLTNSSGDNNDIVIDDNSSVEYENTLRTQVALNPSDAATLAALANYLAQTGRLGEAIDTFEQALALNPSDWVARLDFARSLADGGKRNDAELQFKKVVAGDPNNEQAHYFLAQLYRGWVPPRSEEAAAEYRRTIETGPETFVAEEAAKALQELGYGTPAAASPVAATAEATP